MFPEVRAKKVRNDQWGCIVVLESRNTYYRLDLNGRLFYKFPNRKARNLEEELKKLNERNLKKAEQAGQAAQAGQSISTQASPSTGNKDKPEQLDLFPQLEESVVPPPKEERPKSFADLILSSIQETYYEEERFGCSFYDDDPYCLDFDYSDYSIFDSWPI